jgi:hypothetical protein
MERDFEAGGRSFKLNKIDTFKQFHIVRRLGPILGDLIPVAQKLKGMKVEGMTEDQSFEAIAAMSAPIMEGISKLSDEDANLVLLGLCSSVEVKQEPAGNWARVASASSILMNDIELPILLQIAGRAFMFNLSGFFSTAPQTSHGRK